MRNMQADLTTPGAAPAPPGFPITAGGLTDGEVLVIVLMIVAGIVLLGLTLSRFLIGFRGVGDEGDGPVLPIVRDPEDY